MACLGVSGIALSLPVPDAAAQSEPGAAVDSSGDGASDAAIKKKKKKKKNKKKKKKKNRTRPGARATAQTEFTSNLYHALDRRSGQFDTKTDPGERYYKMAGPSDLVTEVGLEVFKKWRVAKKRRAGATLAGAYAVPVRNTIADHAEIEAGVYYDPSRTSRVTFTAGIEPSRFYKNYRVNVGGAKQYEAARYTGTYAAAELEHTLSKAWTASLEYAFKHRSFDDPFTNHDTNRHRLTAWAAHELGSSLNVALGVRVAQVGTPHDLEFGVEVDRSYRTASMMAAATRKFTKQWRGSVDFDVRLKDYTTDVDADMSHFDRTDRRLRIALEAERRIGKKLSARFSGGWTDNNSDRIDPRYDDEEQGYVELLLGVGLKYRL